MNITILRAIYRSALLLSLLALAGISTGCASSDQGSLRMVSVDQKHDLDQCFSQAYISRTPSGDTDIVMVCDAGAVSNDADPRQPLKPEASIMPRQLVHIRVFWKAISNRADHPANTNASIHWYLLGDSPDQTGMLEYAGSGLVTMDNASGGAKVDIRTAWMKSVNKTGGMTDPLGPSMLKGEVRATSDAKHVAALLAEIDQITTSGAQAPPRAVNRKD